MKNTPRIVRLIVTVWDMISVIDNSFEIVENGKHEDFNPPLFVWMGFSRSLLHRFNSHKEGT